MSSRQEVSELRQKRLAKERQARFRKKQKIDHVKIMDERRKKSIKEKLANDRQSRLIRRQNIKNNNHLPETQIPSETFEQRQKRLAKERQARFRKSNSNERRMDGLKCITRHDLG